MKQIVWVALLAGALSMTGLLPFESRDVASLVPVETLTVDVRESQVVLNGGEYQGYGTDWETALADLHAGGEGNVFLGTAEQVVLSQSATSLLPDIIRSQELRPAAVVCVCQGIPPKPEDVTKYLSAHDAGITIQKVQAVMLRGEGIKLPVLVQTEGGLRLYGTENG